MDTFKDTATITAGSYGGTKLTDVVEKQIAVKRPTKANQLAPLVSGAIGILGQLFIKNPRVKMFCLGMTAVSLTEVVEKITTKKTATNPYSGEPIEGSRVGASQKLNGTRVGASQKLNGYRTY